MSDQKSPADCDLDGRLGTAYGEHRAAMLAVAYRMLGVFGDAEDVVQEAFVRFRAALASGAQPDSERAYLVTITTRLAIDELRSARKRRETYVGPWLPEPAVVGHGPEPSSGRDSDPVDVAVLSDSLSTAFLVLLERLGPEQRAALLLRDVFDLPYAQVANVLGKSEAACRQLAARARRRVRQVAPVPTAADHIGDARELANRFFAAARDGDLDALVAHLAHDAEFVGDGGDSRRGVARVIQGAEEVARAVRGMFRRMAEAGVVGEPTAVGNQPGVLLLDPEGGLLAVWSLAIRDGQVHAVHGVVNPEKLTHLGLPVSRLLRR